MNGFGARSTRAAALVGLWIAGCAAGLAALWSVEGPPVASPPPGRAELVDWVSTGQALDTFAALCRVAATIALVYLMLAALLQVAVCTWGSPGLRTRVGRFNPAPIAAMVSVAVAGIGPLAGASPSSATGSDRSPGDSPPPTMVLVEEEPPLDEEPPLEEDPPVEVDLPALETPAPQPTLTVVVQPGDHLWSIAESRVHLALGDTASESDVHSYWIALIDTNADRFVEPGNADLIVPGQELVLPA